MKKLLLGIIVLFLLSGCTFKKDDASAQINYQSYYQSILDNDKFVGYSNYYAVSAERMQADDGSYRYYIFIDHPQIAMYNIRVMAIENDVPYEENRKMTPSFGILEGKDYHMIPYQINSEKGYVKGISISGDSDSEENNIKMVVVWTDEKHNTYREYIAFTLDAEHATYVANDVKAGR